MSKTFRIKRMLFIRRNQEKSYQEHILEEKHDHGKHKLWCPDWDWPSKLHVDCYRMCFGIGQGLD